MKYNKKIVIFEKINGRFEPTRKDRAMELKFGRAGDTVFYLAKNRKYLPVPVIQTGRRKYWFAIREDGEWRIAERELAIDWSVGDPLPLPPLTAAPQV